MDRDHLSYEYLQRQTAEHGISPAGTVLYGVVAIYIIHQVFVYFDYPVLSPQEILWNAIVYVLPKQFLLDSARRQELEANGMLSQTHAAKSDALRRVLGMGGSAVMQSMPASGIMRRASTSLFAKPKAISDAPPGLGNWDNSCYQNSVLQGLASLDTLKSYLERTTEQAEREESTTSSSLLETLGKLKNADNNGKHLWTPAKLKSMSSWQQQDAQEYFSKIMDELDREAAKVTSADIVKPGLETVVEEPSEGEEQESMESEAKRNPMEGQLVQKVACTRCDFSEGLSMIPFNCLTVPLGTDFAYDLDECLDEYTKLEEITDVECAKCTLLRAEKQLTAMLPQAPSYGRPEKKPEVDSKVLSLPPELRAQAFRRLAAIQTALNEDDFEDKTIAEKCEIGKKARVSSTKTRQAVVARAPQSLVVHVNRSVFDETTGVQRKNYANVRWPGELDLGSWMLRAGDEEGGTGMSLLDEDGEGAVRAKYRIKAVVTHYGRHENGHYICYRRHPVHIREETVEEAISESGEEVQREEGPQKQLEERWWRLSDEDVSSVSEDEVLAQGGVFMLFYERIYEDERLTQPTPTDVAVAEAPEEPVPGEAEEVRVADAEAAPIEPASDPISDDAPEEATIEQPSATPSLTSTTNENAPPAVGPSAIHATVEDTRSEDALPATEPSTSAVATDTESEAEKDQASADEQSQLAQKSTTPPMMRTARGRQTSKSEKLEGFGGMGMRAMAAT